MSRMLLGAVVCSACDTRLRRMRQREKMRYALEPPPGAKIINKAIRYW
jgi:hypothetical protein